MKTYIIRFDGIIECIKAYDENHALSKFKSSNRLKGLVSANITEVNND